ncbi:MAG: polyprenyl synthetase family protein, partial [Planctomycetota bacterium]
FGGKLTALRYPEKELVSVPAAKMYREPKKPLDKEDPFGTRSAQQVHDDVLDEADTRRQAPTINRMHGNEVAVILGDFLISQSFHLCSTLDTQKTALRVGEITSTVCCGELLQLDRRGDVNVDEDTYFAIVQRKTGALIGVAAELGARHAGASDTTCARLFDAGCRLGVAFQIQDDLLDLVGDESVVGKSLGKDLEKGKVTLPLVHYLNVAGADARERMEQIIRADEPLNGVRRSICADLEASGSIAYARETAARLVAEAKDGLLTLPDTPARAALLELADTVITRRR